MGKSQYLLQAVRYSDIEFCSSFVPSYLKIIKDCFFLLLSRQLNLLLSRANKGSQGRNVSIVVPKHHIEKISLLLVQKTLNFTKFIFAIESFVLNIAEFIFTMEGFEK